MRALCTRAKPAAGWPGRLPPTAAGREPAFDGYLIVDWSAAATPKRGPDSIWWTFLRWQQGELVEERTENPSTRSEAEAAIRGELVRLAEAGRSVFVGFDFPYAWPAGLAAKLALQGTPWRALWRHVAARIRDDQRAAGGNNRFEVAAAINRALGGSGPFWGLPSGRSCPGLSPTRPPQPWPVPELRLAERVVRGPKSAFQLLGAGSVGSQTLMGIPVLERLRFHPALAAISAVWPFETGPRLPEREPGRARIVHAEIYPSLVDHPVPAGWVKDRAQVIALGRHLARLDAAGELAALFAAPARLAPADRLRVVEEEGWILGVP